MNPLKTPEDYERFADKSSWAQEERKMIENQHKSNSSVEAGCSGCLFWLLILAFFIGNVLEQCGSDKKPRTQRRQRSQQVQSSKKPMATFVSPDGNLKIRQLRSYQEACATGQPSDSYYVKDGVSGVLYPSECGQYGSDAAEYKFVDRSGNERCTGKAVIAFGGIYGGGAKAVTYWEIQNAVSGYNCSTIGETYEIGMRSPQ
jgi:hypothetical protein